MDDGGAVYLMGVDTGRGVERGTGWLTGYPIVAFGGTCAICGICKAVPIGAPLFV